MKPGSTKMLLYKVNFVKHFDANGLGDDYPTDELRIDSLEVDAMYVDSEIGEAGYGTETWQYEIEAADQDAFEAALVRCDTLISYELL